MAGIGRVKVHKRVRFEEGAGNGSSRNISQNAGVNSDDHVYRHRNGYGTHEYNSYDDEADEAGDDGLDEDISTSRRRNRNINEDGYGSDASDQDEIVNMSDYSDDADEREGPDGLGGSDRQHEGEDNDDMFADNNEGSSVSLAHSADHGENKRKRYLGLDDIEGQEASSTSRVDSAKDSLELRGTGDRKGKQPANNESDGLLDGASDDDSDDNSKGKTKIEAFNMRDDLEQGQFDVHGNFVWNKKDPNDYQDSWLDGVSKKAIREARDSKSRQDKNQTVQENSLLQRWDDVPNDDLIVAIINRLGSRETIFSALARIGGPKKGTRNKWSKKAKAKARAKDGDIASEESEKEKQRRNDINELTELADQAMARGMVDVYDQTYEQFVRQMRMTNRIPEDWEPGTMLATLAFSEKEASGHGDDAGVTERADGLATGALNETSGQEEEVGGLLDDLDDLGQSH
ncbi:hypothetical protein H4S06_000708 [Coemansia sp. BCRC 34490]|nr:hypothetical protein H4S06_000708 [Coemansia sp. BCRC 34490]